jgi:hypothetical protein
MFHCFKFPYFTCTFFTKFIYNEYVGPYFYRTLFLNFFPVNPPRIMNNTTLSAMDEKCDESIQGVLVYHSESIYFGVFLYGHTYAMQSI